MSQTDKNHSAFDLDFSSVSKTEVIFVLAFSFVVILTYIYLGQKAKEKIEKMKNDVLNYSYCKISVLI